MLAKELALGFVLGVFGLELPDVNYTSYARCKFRRKRGRGYDIFVGSLGIRSYEANGCVGGRVQRMG